MRHFTHLMYTAVAVSLLLTATILVAPMSMTNGFDFMRQAQASGPGVHFKLTDDPGSWFRNEDSAPIGATDSLALATPGTTVYFDVISETNTVHTVTSLLWPTGAANMPFDQDEAFQGFTDVTLEDSGLYVFVCKLHPFMLGAVIVDDGSTEGLDLGETFDMINGLEGVPTNSDLAVRLLRGFYVITSPSTWQDFSAEGRPWVVNFPPVDVRLTDGATINLSALNIDTKLPKLFKPKVSGVGQVWIATQYEETENRNKPGTLTVVDVEKWKVIRKVSLPDMTNEMNNPHNMWADANQERIYVTQWFDKYVTTVDRNSGEEISNIFVGEAPAHVMTRTNTDQVHVGLNGEGSVAELAPGGGSVERYIDVTGPVDNPAQPHAHWMGFDGMKMVTPNSNTGDSTLYSFATDSIVKNPTGTLPIATGMMPDSSKYYVSNFLDSTISVMNGVTGAEIKEINLLADYHPITGEISDGVNPLDEEDADGVVAVGALPIQTPVAPNGKYMVTANTLTATITIVDTDDDMLEKMLPCDAGCHGVQFGAKEGGGYYAYVTSKFANTLLVVDIDPNNDGEANDAAIAGRILLNPTDKTLSDDEISAYSGMGGQGVLAVPNVYNGWVQNLPDAWKNKLTADQQNPYP